MVVGIRTQGHVIRKSREPGGLVEAVGRAGEEVDMRGRPETGGFARDDTCQSTSGLMTYTRAEVLLIRLIQILASLS